MAASITSVVPVTKIAGETAANSAAITSTATALPSAAPAGGTGAAAGGWDTSGNRDSAITTINSTRTLVGELKTAVDAILVVLRAKGLIDS